MHNRLKWMVALIFALSAGLSGFAAQAGSDCPMAQSAPMQADDHAGSNHDCCPDAQPQKAAPPCHEEGDSAACLAKCAVGGVSAAFIPVLPTGMLLALPQASYVLPDRQGLVSAMLPTQKRPPKTLS